MRILLIALLLLICPISVFAQCVGTITDVRIDDVFGYVLVETEYTLNGVVVETGHTRYSDINGTDSEIIELVKRDVAIHCENIILRIESNVGFIQGEIKKKEEEVSTPIVDRIKAELIGHIEERSEVTHEHKGLIITVTAEGKNEEVTVDGSIDALPVNP